jgi:hypothetical protein
VSEDIGVAVARAKLGPKWVGRCKIEEPHQPPIRRRRGYPAECAGGWRAYFPVLISTVDGLMEIANA